MKSLKMLTLLLILLFCFNCSNDEVITTPPDSQEQTYTITEQEQSDDHNDSSDDVQTDNSETQTIENIDISEGLPENDLENHPMQDIAKPNYLQTIIDPSFGTTIRRISNAADGQVIKPMYSTIQAWNADESYMILYDKNNGVHQLLNGMDYTFIRNLDDIYPDDLEQIYWDFNDPDTFYYVDRQSSDFIQYSISQKTKAILVNLGELSGCSGNIGSGNDVQMMSWDSDVIGFRCDNTAAYYYRISTKELTTFNLNDVEYTAPMPLASGNGFYHSTNIYNTTGTLDKTLNENKTEHSCLGKLINGNDAHFAIAFSEGPQGGCLGNIIAHDIATGECFPVISESQGYPYPLSGTHISAVSHKNPGWVAASLMGYDQDGQSLLDQELVIARVEKGNVKVYRIGHHRADEDEFDYWGEPHAVISPTGTRVIFGSDWSGSDDGKSVDTYVVELPSFK
ncbi:hypothetical protein JQC67_07745 [Aurantibacter crassamenti]|uniref:hypothetical protein n=1 Tax=Aurantibacter crassamenti TaxID=1837375 RepID=UPI00193ADBB6|nr:hypothetical protein [Aurantibacter crassamenti]MBM1106024.1 hypothetical protein [Aurantibacter crassamenti]